MAGTATFPSPRGRASPSVKSADAVLPGEPLDEVHSPGEPLDEVHSPGESLDEVHSPPRPRGP